MKRGLVVVGIITAICALFTGCAKKETRTQKTDCSSGLKGCSYSRAGGMEGGYVYIELLRDGDSWVILKKSRNTHSDEATKERCVVPESAARGLEEFFAWHDCENWKNLKIDEKRIAFDESTSGITVELADGRSFSARDILDMPEEELWLCTEVYHYLNSYTAEVELLELDAGDSSAMVFSKPEMVDCVREERPDGAVYLLRGRIPGELTATLSVDGKAKPKRYRLKVDKDYSVALVTERKK